MKKCIILVARVTYGIPAMSQQNTENDQPKQPGMFKQFKRNVRQFAREGQYLADRRILNSSDCKITRSVSSMMDTEIDPKNCKYVPMLGEPMITVME